MSEGNPKPSPPKLPRPSPPDPRATPPKVKVKKSSGGESSPGASSDGLSAAGTVACVLVGIAVGVAVIYGLSHVNAVRSFVGLPERKALPPTEKRAA